MLSSDILTIFVDLEITKYLFMSFTFFGLNLCVRRLIRGGKPL